MGGLQHSGCLFTIQRKVRAFWRDFHQTSITSLHRFPSDVAQPSGKLRCIHASSQNIATRFIFFQETKPRVIYNSNHLIIQVAISAFSTSKKKTHHPKLQVQLTTENHPVEIQVKVWTQHTLVRPRTEMSSSSKRWFSRWRAAWLGWGWLDFSPHQPYVTLKFTIQPG